MKMSSNHRSVTFKTWFCFILAGALKEIQTRIPDIVRLYALGSTPSALVSAVNLDKKLEESSPGRPEISHSKSFSGTKRSPFFIGSM